MTNENYTCRTEGQLAGFANWLKKEKPYIKSYAIFWDKNEQPFIGLSIPMSSRKISKQGLVFCSDQTLDDAVGIIKAHIYGDKR